MGVRRRARNRATGAGESPYFHYGASLLHTMTLAGKDGIVSFLLQRGADPNCQDNGRYFGTTGLRRRTTPSTPSKPSKKGSAIGFGARPTRRMSPESRGASSCSKPQAGETHISIIKYMPRLLSPPTPPLWL